MRFILALIFAITANICLAKDSSFIEQNFYYDIRTSNTDSVFQKIIDYSESKGGYFTQLSTNNISLRLPVSYLPEFQKIIESFSEITNKNFSGTSQNGELEKLNSQIESRKKLLLNYIDLVKGAPVAELQMVEREMINLNAQIENLKGRKMAIEKKAELALITIYAYTKQPYIERTEPFVSPFNWLNATDINSLRRDF